MEMAILHKGELSANIDITKWTCEHKIRQKIKKVAKIKKKLAKNIDQNKKAGLICT